MIRFLLLLLVCGSATWLFAQSSETITGWQMQDVTKVSDAAEVVSTAKFHPDHWYAATVPGTVLTTLVNTVFIRSRFTGKTCGGFLSR